MPSMLLIALKKVGELRNKGRKRKLKQKEKKRKDVEYLWLKENKKRERGDKSKDSTEFELKMLALNMNEKEQSVNEKRLEEKDNANKLEWNKAHLGGSHFKSVFHVQYFDWSLKYKVKTFILFTCLLLFLLYCLTPYHTF